MIILSIILLGVVYANAYFLHEYILCLRDKKSKIESVASLFAAISIFLAAFNLAKIVYELPTIDVKITTHAK